jgi:hypothetical protein
MSDLDPLSAPEITLRGKTYKLPEMELKQVIPLTARLLKLRGGKFTEFSEEQLTEIFDVMFLVLTFVEPGVTREEYDKSPPSYPEMLAAFPVIMRQARFIVRGENKDQPAGEAVAETSTGIS